MKTVIHSVNPYLEPTTVWIHDQIRSLRRYTPIVYSRHSRNVDRFPVERLVDFTSAGVGRRLLDRVSIRLKGTYPRYGRHMVEDQADLIHAHFGQEGYRCLAARKEANIPLVTTFYGLDVSALPKVLKWQKRFDRLFEEGDLFLAEGPHMASCLVDIGCPEDKVRVQRLGIDLDAFPFHERSHEETYEVLMYASMREKKGHKYGIEAFARVRDKLPSATLTLIGDGPLRGEIELQIRSMGLSDDTTFLGSLSHSDCVPILNRADVLLYPSVMASDGDTEGGAPVGIIEAMACGLPVVSTKHADIPYVLMDGEAGIVVDERDVTGLANGVLVALQDQQATQACIKAARTAAEERHSLTAQAISLEAAYDSVCT